MPDDAAPAQPVPSTQGATHAGTPHVRLSLTPAAAELLARLRVQYGELMFHLQVGAGEESPMCYPQGEFLTSETDVHLGDLVVDDLFSELADPVLSVGSPTARRGGLRLRAADPDPGGSVPTFTVPFWTGRCRTGPVSSHLTVDVRPGGGSGFSVEAPEGVRFVVRDTPPSDDDPSTPRGRRP